MFLILRRGVVALVAVLMMASSQAAIEVNKASLAELEGIKGVGPSTSTKILSERQRALFTDWDDIINRVQGLGPKKATKLSAQGLTVNGSPYRASEKPLVKMPGKSARAVNMSSPLPAPSSAAPTLPSSGYIRWSKPPEAASAEVNRLARIPSSAAPSGTRLFGAPISQRTAP